jgi:RimJ/RimL family protein N-acetyltransferase
VYDAAPPADGIDSYTAVVSPVDGELIGFFCVGEHARVPGLAADTSCLDVGLGLAPHWVGRGYGAAFTHAVVGFVAVAHPGLRLRAVIQSWNRRALRAAQRAGFTTAGTHFCVQHGRDVEYTVVVLASPAGG